MRVLEFKFIVDPFFKYWVTQNHCQDIIFEMMWRIHEGFPPLAAPLVRADGIFGK
jgi:hypothetical protein